MDLISEKKTFNRQVIALGFPVALQNFLSSINSFADTLMIGSMGEDAVAGVSCANQMFFFVSLIVWGCISGASVLMSQYYGNSDRVNFQVAEFFSLLFNGFIIAVIFLFCFFRSNSVLGIFTNEQSAIEIGSRYIRIVSLTYLLFAVSNIFSVSMRCCFMARQAMIAGVVGIAVNIVFNYAFIFGKFGFSAMGIEGAAYATVLARSVELVSLIGYVYLKKPYCAVNFVKVIHNIDLSIIKKFLSVTLPVILNETGWALGMMCYNVIYGRMGIQTMAAVSVSESVKSLFLSVGIGFGNAVCVITGNAIGKEHDKKLIMRLSKFTNTYSLVGGLLVAVLMALCSPFVVSFFKLADSTILLAKYSLLWLCISVFLKFYTCSNIIGTLRGAGDTKYCAFIDLSGLWLVGVPVALLMAFVFKLNLIWVESAYIAEELYKVLLIHIRLNRNDKWIRDYTKEA